MKRLACVAILMACHPLSAQTLQKGWKAVTGQNCRYAVPSGWTQNVEHAGVSSSPDNKVSIVAQAVDRNQPFADVEKNARAKMPPLKVFEDSARREWYVYRDPADGEDSPDTHWYVAVRARDQTCAVQITFKSAIGDSLPRQIVRTIEPLK